MTDTVTVLKALADETRLRILNLLQEGRDLCLCEIEAVLRLTQSNASRHLSRLREAGLIGTEKRGQWTHFHLVSENVSDHRSARPKGAAGADGEAGAGSGTGTDGEANTDGGTCTDSGTGTDGAVNPDGGTCTDSGTGTDGAVNPDGGTCTDPAADAGDLLRLVLTAARDSMDVLSADRRALQAYRSSPYRCETIRTWREVYWSAPDS